MSKEKEFDVGYVEFEVSEVYPGRDNQMVLKFRRYKVVIDTDLEIIDMQLIH